MPRPPIPASRLEGSGDPERRFRFMEVVRRRLVECRDSERTSKAYLQWIRRFIRYHDRRPPRDLAVRDVAAFLSYLAVTEGVAGSTQNQALAALLFLYERVIQTPLERIPDIAPARRSRHVPIVLTPAEIRGILANLREPFRVCALLMYGSGLRVTECVTLQVKDVNLERREVIVRAGEGDRDRRTPMLGDGGSPHSITLQSAAAQHPARASP